ncbi:MAG TPA: Tat pathway signal protein [Sphingomicrobium sp.]|nr:Tat pathway signal protein [Sphingomicrobium sp.]
MDRRQILIGGGALAAVGVGATLVGRRQMGSSLDYDAATASMRAPLPNRPQIRELVRYATLAPNSHNTQAWLFRASDHRIDILPDMSRRTPVVDPDDHHLFVSLGCAAENLALASAARGLSGDPRFDPATNGSVAFEYRAAPSVASVLFDAIPARQSTRADYDGRTVGVADLRTLATAAAVPGVDLVLITDRREMGRISDLVVAGTSAQMTDPAFVRELKSWLRFSPRQALKTGDGLYSVASGNPALPEWLGTRAFDWLVTAKSETDRYARQMRSSAGIAIFIAQQDNREHWVLAGRACQRFALQATALGLKYAFINQPLEVVRLRPELAALVGMSGSRPDIVMRFGYGPTLPYSARRPAETVMRSK